MDELNVPSDIREKLYCDNFLRFIGKKKEKIEHILPIADSTIKWKV